jgi:hypothetical protein
MGAVMLLILITVISFVWAVMVTWLYIEGRYEAGKRDTIIEMYKQKQIEEICKGE